MARMKRSSNPTGLVELSHAQIQIELSEVGTTRTFALKQINLGKTSLPADAFVVCVVRAGRSAARYELGRLASWDQSHHPLLDIDASEVPKFRVLIRDPGSPKLLASAENIRLRDPGQSESLIPIDVVDLGQLAWRYREDDEDGAPTLQVNKLLYPSAAAAEQDAQFICLVLPDALRRVCWAIIDSPDGLKDPGNWRSQWTSWLSGRGAVLPPPLKPNKQAADSWVEGVVEKFCSTHNFCSKLLAQREVEGGK
jgi:hypothetical protein